MRLMISGRPDNRFLRKTLIRSAVRYFCKRLFENDPKILRRLKVNLTYDILQTGYQGFAHYKDPKRDGYSYNVFVDSRLGFKPSLITLAHELVHVKQYSTREYVSLHATDGEVDLVQWQGARRIDCNEVDYWDHPWEIEAHGRELGLYIRFVNDTIDLNGKL